MKERPPGFRAIVEYTEKVHTMAQEYIKNFTVRAKTAAHKLEVALAMQSAIGRDELDERRISRLCARDPDLLDIVVLRLDLVTGLSTVGKGLKEAIAARCREMAEEVLREKTKVEEKGGEEEKDEGDTTKGYSLTSETIRKLKQLQQRKRITLTELWDEDKNIFVSDEDEMAETIKAARRRLEHTQSQTQEQDDGEAEPEPDKALLEGWGADFSKCRTRLERREIEIIILDQKAGKSPGPDGVRGELLKRHAYPLSKIFCEA